MNPRTWFYDLGLHVFPIDRNDKSPIVPKGTSQFDYRCTRFEAERLGDYGVPLDQMAVADSDDPVSEAWVSANLPDTPFKVTTARGRHRYYLLKTDAPHFFHRAGLTIEFRHRGQYVVGPGSVHKTGVVYTPDSWSWKIEDVPVFPVEGFTWDDRPLEQRGSAEGQPFVLPPVVHAGERHDMMFKLMRSLQARGVTELPWLLKVLHAENLIKCHPPIERNELERYISRVYKYRDKPGFERDTQEPAVLAGGLLDAGVSIDAAITAAQAVDPAFNPHRHADLDVIDRPQQPSQPFSSAQAECSNRPVSAADIDIVDIAKPSLGCAKCAHVWVQKRLLPPKKCPHCRSTLWNRELLHVESEDENDEIFDLTAGDKDIEIIDEDDDSPVFEEPEEDGPIYDEETGEIVGHTINGKIVWNE